MKFWSVALLTGVVAAFVGPGVAGCSAGVDCSSAGCGASAAVALPSGVVGGAPGPWRVQACIEDHCTERLIHRTEIAGGDNFEIGIEDAPGAKAGRRYDLTIRVAETDGTVVARGVGAATLVTYRPNGPRCSPTCLGVRAVTVLEPLP